LGKNEIAGYHIFFSGSVQGVGFRYTARSIAQQYGLTGWVRNTSDGRVEILAEGSRVMLDALITDLRAEFIISDVDIVEGKAEEKYKGFNVAL